MLLCESLSSHTSIDKKIKEMKRKIIIRNEMKKKRNINIDLAILPSHDNEGDLRYHYMLKDHHINHGSLQKHYIIGPQKKLVAIHAMGEERL